VDFVSGWMRAMTCIAFQGILVIYHIARALKILSVYVMSSIGAHLLDQKNYFSILACLPNPPFGHQEDA